MPPEKSPFLARIRALLRLRHYSRRTEQAYVAWIKRFILFHGKEHPEKLGEKEVQSFLTDLAVSEEVAASTQNQALNALVFLYTQVLDRKGFGDFSAFVRAKRPRYVPVVLSREETKRLLDALEGTYALMASLLYGTGMRLMECVRLRVKDVDFGRSEITIRQGKGNKDRRTMLPVSLVEPLRGQVGRLQAYCIRMIGGAAFQGWRFPPRVRAQSAAGWFGVWVAVGFRPKT